MFETIYTPSLGALCADTPADAPVDVAHTRSTAFLFLDVRKHIMIKIGGLRDNADQKLGSHNGVPSRKGDNLACLARCL